MRDGGALTLFDSLPSFRPRCAAAGCGGCGGCGCGWAVWRAHPLVAGFRSQDAKYAEQQFGLEIGVESSSGSWGRKLEIGGNPR